MNKFVSVQEGRLVANLLEVLAQLGDAVEGVGGLDIGRVVCDQERLGCLVGYDTFLALHRKLSVSVLYVCALMLGVIGRVFEVLKVFGVSERCSGW